MTRIEMNSRERIVPLPSRTRNGNDCKVRAFFGSVMIEGPVRYQMLGHVKILSFSLGARTSGERKFAFYDRDWRLADHLYFAIEQQAHEKEVYLGSWMIVAELLRSRGMKGDLRLFDISDSAAKALKDEAGFSQSCGFQAVFSSPHRPDLILCDPAYSEQREQDWRSIRDFASKCSGDNLPALIWYPVFIKEPALAKFAENVMAEVRWSCRGANQMMRGCGIIALGPAGQIVRGLRAIWLK